MRDLTALRRGALVLLVLCMCLLSASNGFTVDVFGIQAFRGRPAKLVIYVRKGATGVQYIAPGTVTETSMHADLGDLGIVALEFKRTDQAVRVPCGKRKIPFDTGGSELRGIGLLQRRRRMGRWPRSKLKGIARG